MFIRHRLEPLKTRSLRHHAPFIPSSTAMPLQDALKEASDKTHPVILKHPRAAENAAKSFLTGFCGETMYAVKSNQCPDLLRTLWESGIRSFDVASIHEIRSVQLQLPYAKLNFMNPVKNEQAIRDAYTIHGVRTFSLDSMSELEKILRATEQNNSIKKDLTLCIRIYVESTYAKLGMSRKFGTTATNAKILLQAARSQVDRLGICFHVGSQCMNPEAYRQGLLQAHAIALEARVRIDIVDLGGGFPVDYPGMMPPPLSRFFETINDTISHLPLFHEAQLWIEPGRGLSAQYNSLVVHVQAIRDLLVYIDDGLYGNLHDASRYNWSFKAKLLREEGEGNEEGEFSLCGPTCDDDDIIKGPVKLPKIIATGDAIWFQATGAYGTALRTKFNGCHVTEELLVSSAGTTDHGSSF